MTDIATLGLRVDSSSVPRATGHLDRFEVSSRRADTGAQAVSNSSRAMGAAMRSAAAGIAAAAASFASLRQVYSSAEQFTRMTNSLRAIGMSATEASATLDQIAAVANRTRAPLEATAQLYQRISIAGQDLGATGDQVLNFTENVGLALAQTGTSAQEASGALLQLSQAMSGGIVRAEEFNSILEGAFPIAQAAARGIEGAAGSVGKLRNMIVEGEVTSREFFDAILSQTDQLREAFENTTPTIGQAFTVLGNNLTTMVGQMDATVGASGAVAQAILLMADNLDRLATYAGVAAVAIGARYAGAAALAAARTYGLAGAMTALRGAIARTGIGVLIVGAGELAFRFGNLVSATGGFGNALGALGETASAVWQSIIDGASAIPPSLEGVWQSMKAGFLRALSEMATSFHDFIWRIGNQFGSIPGLEGISADLMAVAETANEASGSLMSAAGAAEGAAEGAYGRAGGIIKNSVDGVREAVAGLNRETKIASDTINSLPSGLTSGSVPATAAAAAGGSGGGRGGSSGGSAAAGVTEAMEQTALAGESAASRVSEAFRGMASDIRRQGMSLGEAMGEMMHRIADNMIDGGISRIADALGSVVGNFFSGGVTRGAGGAIAGALGSAIAGARANGGPVRADEPYLVNENTPRSEVFVPSRSGGVLNVPQAQEALRGSAGGAPKVQVEVIGGDLSIGDDGQLMQRVRVVARDTSSSAVREYDQRVMPQRFGSNGAMRDPRRRG